MCLVISEVKKQQFERPWVDSNHQSFRLTAERANQLRHRDGVVKNVMFD